MMNVTYLLLHIRLTKVSNIIYYAFIIRTFLGIIILYISDMTVILFIGLHRKNARPHTDNASRSSQNAVSNKVAGVLEHVHDRY